MATIYVRDSAASPGTKILYKSGAWPAANGSDGTDNSTITAALAAAGYQGTVILLGPGTYSGAQLGATGIVEGEGLQTLCPGILSATGYNILGGPVVLDGSSIAGHTIFNASFGGLTAKNIKIISPAGYWAYYGGGATMTDVEVIAAGMGLGLGGDPNTLNRVKLSSGGGEWTLRITGTVLANNCIFDGMKTPVYLLDSNGAHTHTFNNSIFTGGQNGSTYSASAVLAETTYAGAAAFNNCNFNGNTVDNYADQYVIDNTSSAGGTVTLNNSVPIQSPRGKGFHNVTINDPVYADPKYISTKRPGYASIAIDDSSNLTVAQSLGSYAPGAVTFFIDGYISDISDPNWTAIGAFINQGNEIGGHTFAGPNLTNLNAITIASSQILPTVEITTTQTDDSPANWTGTIILKENGLSINGAGYSLTAYNTLAALKTIIESNTGWTATVHASAANGCRLVLLKTSTQIVSGAGYLFTFENNLGGSTPVERFWYHEIVYQKKLVEAKLLAVLGSAYTLKTFAYPGGAFSAGLKTFISTQVNYTPLGITKYLGARTAGATSAASWTLASDYTSGTGPAAGIQVYELLAPQLAADIGTTNVDRVAVAWGQWATYAAGYFCFYTHSAVEYSDANAKAFIDGLRQNPNLSLITIGSILSTITTGGLWTDAGSGLRWTRTFTDNPDYRLRGDSPGKIVGNPILTNAQWVANGGDMDKKNPTAGKFSIGPYQYQARKSVPVPFIWGKKLNPSKSTDAGSYVQ